MQEFHRLALANNFAFSPGFFHGGCASALKRLDKLEEMALLAIDEERKQQESPGVELRGDEAPFPIGKRIEYI
jgi:hypothetical protein